MKYHTFLVDADDTIFDFQKAFGLALKQSFEECGIAYKEEYRSVYKRINDSLWKQLERKEISREQLIALRFSRILEELQIDFDDRTLNDTYMKNLSQCSVFIEGADLFLEELQKMGDTYIITNGFTATQTGRMNKFHMERYVKGWFISEQVGYDKPDIRYMEHVFAHIPDFDKDKTIIIGDGLSSDIAAANASGLKSIWFNPHHKPVPQSPTICYQADSYEGIIEILKRL